MNNVTTNQVIINTHEADAKSAPEVDRQHYTVATLIAELNQCDPNASVVIKNLNTGKFGCINFQGISR